MFCVPRANRNTRCPASGAIMREAFGHLRSLWGWTPASKIVVNIALGPSAEDDRVHDRLAACHGEVCNGCFEVDRGVAGGVAAVEDWGGWTGGIHHGVLWYDKGECGGTEKFGLQCCM